MFHRALARDAHFQLFCLPHFWEDDMQQIADALVKVIHHYSK